MEGEIPDEFVDFIEDTAQGFDPQHGTNVELVKKNIVTFVNEKVNLPLVGEKTEEKIFSALINILFEAMTKGKKLGN